MKGGGGGEGRRRRRCWSGRPSVEMEEGGGKVAGDSECIVEGECMCEWRET